ncbi:Signal transduction histidine kinase [bacterium A37T11]|nr:Signal transduction histidine kinase [bacterium A37T11]
MKISEWIDLQLLPVMKRKDNPIQESRIKVLFITLALSTFFFGLISIVLINKNANELLVRMVISFLIYALLLFYLWKTSNWLLVTHVAIIVISAHVWLDTISSQTEVNILTFQTSILITLASFYLFRSVWSICYSIQSYLPIYYGFFIKNHNYNNMYQIDVGLDKTTFIILFTFQLLLIIVLCFFFFNSLGKTLVDLHHSRSEEKILNEQLQKAVKIAEQSAREKTDFLSIMSHELRTPLHGVIGMSNLLLSQKLLGEQSENLKILKFSAENLLALINNILDFNKIDAGVLELDNEEFNPTLLIDDIVSSFRLKAVEKNIGLQAYIDSKLIGLAVYGDAGRLTQVMFNILGNAIKFTNAGEVTIRVQLQEKSEDHADILFEVKDTGIGITPEELKSIFNVFSQANAGISRHYGGTGLGLPIVKHLLMLQNSNIQVESEPNIGSTFSFVIKYPLIKGEYGQQLPRKVEKSLQKNQQATLEGMRILVVEDNEISTILMRKLLDMWKAEAHFAENGLIALNKVKDTAFDIILMDIHMPVMDGFEASRAMRNHGINTPIIALTASVAVDTQNKITKAGIDAYVIKPFKPNELLRVLTGFYKKLVLSGKINHQE